MPITVPPFTQYQGSIIPLRGLWNASAPEGDRFINIELDWPQGSNNCVQINCGANSPVPFSQIVALAVDNSNCGSDLQCLFSDSGFILVVPAYSQGTFPVFTNMTSFYVIANDAAAGDRSIIEVFNTMPPTVALDPPRQRSALAETFIPLGVNATTSFLPNINGTLVGFDLEGFINSSATEVVAIIAITDGNNNPIWISNIGTNNNQFVPLHVVLENMFIRFYNGLKFVVEDSAVTGQAYINFYYTTP